MKSSRTLWVDQTDLINWRGNLTGIQRTVYSLGLNLAQRQDVKFFYFDLTERIFKECDRVKDPGSTVEDSPGNPALKQKTIVSSIKRRVPASIRKPLKRALKVENRISKVIESSSPFKDNDMVIVLGGNWGDDHKGFLNALFESKRLHNLEIIHFIYDLIPIKYPNYFLPGSTTSFVDYVDKLAKFTDHFICISESTSNDLKNYLDLSAITDHPKLSTIRLGEDLPQDTPSQVSSSTRNRITRDFILCVGTIEARKNHAILYYVVKEALQQGKQLPQIVIAGKRGWMTDDIQHMIDNDPDTKENCFIIDSPEDSELRWLYENCLFTIYPSMYEGWGLPLAEAAIYGKVCIASNTSSMPEVIGDYGDYFSPFNTQECLDKIEYYSSSPKNLKVKSDALKKRSQFTWNDSYEDLSKIIQLP